MEQRSDATVVARLPAGRRPVASEQWWQRVRRWRGLLKEALARPLYGAYERRILLECLQEPPPRHVGIILDGNRRHGRRSGLKDPTQIYTLGAEKLDAVLDWCGELAISAVTLWVCSTDNLNRPADEVAGILRAVEAKLRTLTEDPQIHRRRVRVQAIGRLDLLPESTAAAIQAAQDATSHYDGMTLTIAIAYGGREEIVDAVRAVLCEAMRDGASLQEAIELVDTQAIGKNLYLSAGSDPDLIIRTSGEVRLSGFLLWQSAYSEFYFSDVLWPAFRKIDFLRAVRSFQDRKRRFGR
jgi:short-chain Z-isoprenyl diphosphate synthase